MMLIEKYPAAVSHMIPDAYGNLPVYIECKNQARSSIISKCI
jgi:hypothetical protein